MYLGGGEASLKRLFGPSNSELVRFIDIVLRIVLRRNALRGRWLPSEKTD